MKKKKSKLTRIIPVAILVVLGAATGYFGAVVGGKMATTVPAPVMIALAVLLIPAFFFVIAVHEGGHAWAGVRMNFDFRTYVVGPFLWDKQPGGWKFMWNKNINTSGGLVVCIPRGTDDLARRFSFYAAGGPLASLVLVAVAGGIYFMSRVWTEQSIAIQIFVYTWGMIAFQSAAIFIVTSIPLHAGGFSSDGARVLRFLRGGDTARFEMLMLKLVSSSMAGIRPAQLNVDELREAKELGARLDAPMAVYINYFLYQSALDRNELEEAEQHLQEYLQLADEVPQGMREGVWLEAAFYYAVVRKDLTKADEYLRLYKPSALLPVAVEYATRAAIAHLRNEKAEFHSWLAKAEQALPNMMDRGAMGVVQERVAAMKAEGS